MKRPFYHYLRDANGERYGVICATSPDNIGWSLCHPNDQFCKATGRFKARKRAEGRAKMPKHPDKFREAGEAFESGKMGLRGMPAGLYESRSMSVRFAIMVHLQSTIDRYFAPAEEAA